MDKSGFCVTPRLKILADWHPIAKTFSTQMPEAHDTDTQLPSRAKSLIYAFYLQ
jgi:hypothetical protein